MIFDTYAWVEFFNGTGKGEVVKRLLSSDGAATAMPSLSELVSWALKNNRDPSLILEKVRLASAVLPFTNEVAILAGEIHYENKKKISDWGMVDSLIYATALSNGVKLVTGDPHFKGKAEVIFLD